MPIAGRIQKPEAGSPGLYSGLVDEEHILAARGVVIEAGQSDWYAPFGFRHGAQPEVSGDYDHQFPKDMRGLTSQVLGLVEFSWATVELYGVLMRGQKYQGNDHTDGTDDILVDVEADSSLWRSRSGYLAEHHPAGLIRTRGDITVLNNTVPAQQQVRHDIYAHECDPRVALLFRFKEY